MREVGIRALKQNASEVIADVVQGETIVVTDRGRQVAQISPLPNSQLATHIATGMITKAKNPKVKLPKPTRLSKNSRNLSDSLKISRAAERY
ncbi:MAG: type II toxin-antitoxin system Phd/YefM family antitoxin [Acidimicrobiaceae bacterium]